MKKTTETTKTTKLPVRKERIRNLKTPDMEKVLGGLYDVHSLHTSCC